MVSDPQIQRLIGEPSKISSLDRRQNGASRIRLAIALNPAEKPGRRETRSVVVKKS
jgi:hypothetical protein